VHVSSSQFALNISLLKYTYIQRASPKVLLGTTDSVISTIVSQCKYTTSTSTRVTIRRISLFRSKLLLLFILISD
jgi:hypothetical protein